MKKIVLLVTAAFLVSGIAFADGSKKKVKAKCKHEGKTCSKQDMKDEDKTAPAPAAKPAN